MRTKKWIMILAAVLVLSLGSSLRFFEQGSANSVKVISDGEVKYVLPLSQDTQVEIATERGVNRVTIQDGKVAVTEADCPDGYCMARGFCSGGAQIVCLPNRLVLEFSDSDAIDAIAG